ncbi:hypothetical protein G9A89_011214 [Geosiphon pyriformis]|nr:hypothetical protein G9A89_011214 [Geosiphon pyriformis]
MSGHSHLPGTFSALGENLSNVLESNRNWAKSITQHQSDYFEISAKGQQPKIAWFGCSDSRVPAETVVQLGPGEIFVHRNIANQFLHSDLNSLSVLQYAVEHLKVEHVIVCGHYGCGGVAASMTNNQHGIVDSWLLNIKDVYHANRALIDSTPHDKRADLLVDLNVLRQVSNIASSSIVQNTWAKGRRLEVHGWVYDIKTGLLKDLGKGISGPNKLVDPIYKLNA